MISVCVCINRTYGSHLEGVGGGGGGSKVGSFTCHVATQMCHQNGLMIQLSTQAALALFV